MFLVILLFIDMSKIIIPYELKIQIPFWWQIFGTDGVSFSNYPPNDIPTIDIGEFECMIVDPVVATKNIEIAKKKKKKGLCLE
jgi:hypothetical protein